MLKDYKFYEAGTNREVIITIDDNSEQDDTEKFIKWFRDTKSALLDR